MEKLYSDEGLQKLAAYIVDKKYKNVAIQFPDENLNESHTFSLNLIKQLKSLLPDSPCPLVYVIADSAKNSSCCLDIVAADHYYTDCIVQFGHSCCSPIKTKYSIINFFCRESLSFDDFNFALESASELYENSFLILTDTVYTHLVHEISSAVWRNRKASKCQETHDDASEMTEDQKASPEPEIFIGVPYSQYNFPELETVENQLIVFGRHIYKVQNEALYPVEATRKFLRERKILYIGKINFNYPSFLLRIALKYMEKMFFFDPQCNSFSNYQIIEGFMNKFYQKRYAVIMASESAKQIVLLRGTVSIFNTTEIYKRLKKLCLSRNIAVVSIVIGKINVPKLGNFSQPDAFCLLSCPESCFLQDQKDYYKPILTPFELEVLLKYREWTTKYLTEFGSILKKEAKLDCMEKSEFEAKEEQKLALITGGVLVPLSKMVFKGVPYGKDEEFPNTIIEGRRGVASGYADEPQNDKQ